MGAPRLATAKSQDYAAPFTTPWRLPEGRMHYRNSEMKLDQLIGYFNGKKINLIPPFQRGRVWSPTMRRRLLENIAKGRPIPAIFLYKEAAGSQFSYNILDGKQRLESILLYVGQARDDMKVETVKDYFFKASDRKLINFPIILNGKKRTFKQLEDEAVRVLREYAIPTIEIDLDDDSSLDEIINLFVDINSYGEKVKRFDIVKAIGTANPLLKGVFSLVATEQTRRNDKIYKVKSSCFSRVLDKLQVVQSAADANQKVDRIWERLVEIVFFNRTRGHRQPGQILKTFIKNPEGSDTSALTSVELRQLRKVFTFLDKSYAETALGTSRVARDLPHFYTTITALLSSDLLEADGAPPDYPGVREKLIKFSRLLADDAKAPDDIAALLNEYKDASKRQTTHPGSRRTRQTKFLAIMARL